MQQGQQYVVVTSGEGPHVDVPDGAVVVAADGGLERAVALGLEVAVAIGDFDSASPELVARSERKGARVVRHPARKDATDLELALDEAMAMGARRVLVVGSDTGRLDHLTAGLLLLGADTYRELTLDALLGSTRITVIHTERELVGAPGELVTLLPAGGAATGVTTTGLEYPLSNETLLAGTTRGVSNVFVAPTATVSLASGCLLAIQPGSDG
ncbi:MAG: thiamine diphosphokinase [Gaiellales bacterium]